jgi:acyl-coenzyme A thioesterase PaaI-like protein
MKGEAPHRRTDATKKSSARRRFYKYLSFYPPYIGAGIQVAYKPPDFAVRMKQTWFNSNAVGTHFGGSLYTMCDPFFMLILMERLGRDYIIWDKAATIRFVKPGRGTVHADFHIPPETIADIQRRADQGEKVEPELTVDVLDENDQVVAHVEKCLYVRRKNGRAAERG